MNSFLVPVALVAALTAVDGMLRWEIIRAWERRDQLVYGASVLLSVVFWWAVLQLVAALARRGAFGKLGAALLGALAALLLWIPFEVFYRYGTFPTREGALFVANTLGFSLEATGGMTGGADFAILGAAAAFVLAFVLLQRRFPVVRRPVVPFAALVIYVSLASVANLRPTYPVSAESNSIRFLSRLVAWSRERPTFFNLAARFPKPLETSSVPTERPVDVLLIVAETMGAPYLRSFGAPTDPMPRFDGWLSRQDVIPLTNLQSNASCTDLSVPSILTGTFPTMPLGRLLGTNTLLDVFKARGYGTFLVSAHNLRWANLSTFLRNANVDDYFAAENVDPEASNNTGIPDADVLARARSLIERHQNEGERFFGVIQLNTSHPPYQIREDLQPFDASNALPFQSASFARYLNSLRFFDENIGRFLEGLAERPAFRDLLVVFTADHGEAFGQHGVISHCGTFHSEESHVPGFIRLPQGGPPTALRERGQGFVMNVDLFPTILDLAGVRANLGDQLDGRSLLLPPDPDHLYVFSNCSEYRNCSMPHFGLYRRGIKYLFDGHRKAWSAYDVVKDPGETHDLAPALSAEIEALIPAVQENNVLSAVYQGRESGLLK